MKFYDIYTINVQSSRGLTKYTIVVYNIYAINEKSARSLTKHDGRNNILKILTYVCYK